MALSRKAMLYLGIAYAFIGYALFFREPYVTAFVVPITFLFFISRAPNSNVWLAVKSSRALYPDRSLGDEDVEITLKVQNNSHQGFGNVHLDDLIPETLAIKSGTKVMAVSVKSGEAFENRYKISAPKRGTYVLGPLSASVSDIMGFQELTQQIGKTDELIVLPKIEEVGILNLRATRVSPWPGQIPSRKVGSGSEFFELSPYVPGDELRRVNWKASAKTGELVTNEFEGEQATDVLVLLDCSQEVESEQDFDAIEFEASLAASLCSQLIRQGNRVGLSVYGAVRTWVNLGFGRRHLLRILDNLAIAKPGRASIPMDYAVESVIVSTLPSRSVVVVISPLDRDDIVEVVADLATKGYNIVFFTPTITTPSKGTEVSFNLARRILTLERKVRMIHAAKAATLIEVSPNVTIKSALRERKRWRV
jgi:uncharacterized protein (DUF58 family)